jgi:hypothetical protein
MGRRVSELPTTIAAEVQRILDQAARRLLAARLDSDPIGATTGSDDSFADDGADERTLLVEGEQVPVSSADRNGRR